MYLGRAATVRADAENNKYADIEGSEDELLSMEHQTYSNEHTC